MGGAGAAASTPVVPEAVTGTLLSPVIPVGLDSWWSSPATSDNGR
jgi:hypothetical protein